MRGPIIFAGTVEPIRLQLRIAFWYSTVVHVKGVRGNSTELIMNHFSSLICKCALSGVGGLCNYKKTRSPLHMGMMMMQYTTKQGGIAGSQHQRATQGRNVLERANVLGAPLHTFSTELRTRLYFGEPLKSKLGLLALQAPVMQSRSSPNGLYRIHKTQTKNAEAS